jgi:hypothetical protein
MEAAFPEADFFSFDFLLNPWPERPSGRTQRLPRKQAASLGRCYATRKAGIVKVA